MAGKTQRANENRCFSKNHTFVFSAFCEFNQTSLLVCFSGLVCFKLLQKAARVDLVYASQHRSPVIGLSHRRSRWLWCVLSNHIPILLPLFKQLVVQLHCRYATTATFQCIIICGSEIYLSIFLSIGSIALYICMCCFFCVKVSTLIILYICRWYELYVFWFIVRFVNDGLFAHLPLLLPHSIHIDALCYDMSNEGTCFKCSILITAFKYMQKGTLV